MRQTWRWFGPDDVTGIEDILQAGAQGVVSALHHVPYGAVWSPEAIAQRQNEIAHRRDGTPSGLAWEVVESLPVSEEIKTQSGDWRAHVANYCESLNHLARAGIETICYNFMPVLDWTRTDLAWRLPHGGTCMRFDLVDFAMFDIHILGRAGADGAFPEDVVVEAGRRFQTATPTRITRLSRSIMAGLPGEAEPLTLEGLHGQLGRYEAISTERLRGNLFAFLEQVVPVAEKLGLRMCCHPDDPPFPLLGLPRIVSTLSDYQALLSAVDSPANGVTLCSGSLGARADNDLPAMMETLAPKVHFLHLRNTKREDGGVSGSFFEDEHLLGDTDMVALIAAVVREEARRRVEGRADHHIPMRADHGQDILDDMGRGAQPGYPRVGRLKGLAELRGVIAALEHEGVGAAPRHKEAELT